MPLEPQAIKPSDFDRFSDLSTDLLCVVGFDGRITKVNQACERALERSRDDLIGRAVADFVFHEDAGLASDAARRLMAGERVEPIALRIVHKSGGARRFRFCANADRNDRTVWLLGRDTADADARLATVQAVAHLGSWDHDLTTDVRTWSDELYAIYGISPGATQLTDEFIKGRTHPDDRAALETAVERSRLERRPFDLDIRIMIPDGSERWIHSMGQWDFDDSGAPRRVFGTALDITERKRAELARRRSEAILASAQHLAQMGSWESDLLTSEVVASEEFYNIYGLDPAVDRIDRSTLWEFDHPDDLPAIRRAVADSMRDRKRYQLDHRIVRRDGTVRWVHEQGEFTFDGTGRPIAAVGAVLDITSRKVAEERLAFLAHHDALTNLPNRVFLGPRLAQSIARALDNGRNAAVLFLDLDGFKNVNDTLGHRIGDVLLKAVALRLSRCLRPDDCIARTGGDEFVIVADDIASIEDVAAIAGKVVASFATPFQVDGDELFITASVGVCASPQDGVEPETLIRNADTAMYRAKDGGRNRYRMYTSDMHAAVRARLSIEKALRRALEEDEFELHYQPAVELGSGVIVGCEALLRWRSKDRGLRSPADFILVAEESGLIVPIGAWVMREAARQSRAWADADIACAISVNVSGRRLRDATFIDEVWRAISDSGADAKLLGIEITESAALGEPEVARDVLGECRRLGMDVLLDDFGTHYSSLTYLKKLPIDVIKIDRSFVAGLPGDAGDAAIVNSVIGLGESLHCRVIAEGVERPDQAAWLRDAGCRHASGFWFARPMPAAEFAITARGILPGGKNP